jgi:glycosyltransferase involved in cell wall biosynthesis
MHADPFPKVSVLVVTYNHEKFIRQALNSVVMQQTAFKFEVLIADDCSTDATAAVVREYETAHANIRLLPTDDHGGITRNYQRAFAACRGEYVAILEGDDYWICPAKLSLLSTYLDQHPECVFCFHRIIRHDEVADKALALPPIVNGNKSQTFTARELARRNFIGGLSACFYRRSAIAGLDPGIWKLKFREWPFNIVMAQQGLIGYVPEIMSVYRAHPGGIWSLRPPAEHFRQLSEIIDSYGEFLNFKYDAEFRALKREYVESMNPAGAEPALLRIGHWVKPFVPPIVVSLLKTIFYRHRRPG